MVIEIEGVSENSYVYQNLFWYLEVYKKAEFFKLITPSVTQALFSWQNQAEVYP